MSEQVGVPPGRGFAPCSGIFWFLRAELSKWMVVCGPLSMADVLADNCPHRCKMETRSERLPAAIAQNVWHAWHGPRPWPDSVNWVSASNALNSLRKIGEEYVVISFSTEGRRTHYFGPAHLIELATCVPFPTISPMEVRVLAYHAFARWTPEQCSMPALSAAKSTLLRFSQCYHRRHGVSLDELFALPQTAIISRTPA